MTRTFCTLFDKNYLYQGVALHLSLVRHVGEFKLYALCMDDISYALLAKIASPALIPINVEDLVTPEILRVRERTTHGQFCWVCQPLICQFVLDKFHVDMVTYLEADSLFFSSPEPIFDELGNKSVSLVPHNYAPGLNNTDTAGEFCVQFNAFRNDDAARQVLAHWREYCFKYDKAAPSVYPGQTCLGEWPHNFDCVAVIKHRGAGVAPWNVRGYKLKMAAGSPLVDGMPVIFYHYHQYGRYSNGAYELGSYPLTKEIIECFYPAYVDAISDAEDVVRGVDPQFNFRREHQDYSRPFDVVRSLSKASIKGYVEFLKRKMRGRYNVFPPGYFSKDTHRSGV